MARIPEVDFLEQANEFLNQAERLRKDIMPDPPLERTLKNTHEAVRALLNHITRGRFPAEDPLAPVVRIDTSSEEIRVTPGASDHYYKALVDSLKESLIKAQDGLATALRWPNVVSVEAALILGREVACELVYRNRASWDPEHPNRALRTRSIEVGRLTKHVIPDLLWQDSDNLKTYAASVVDAETNGSDGMLSFEVDREDEVQRTYADLVKEHNRLKEELGEWRAAGRALGIEGTTDPRASLLATLKTWEAMRLSAATSTLRYFRTELGKSSARARSTEEVNGYRKAEEVLLDVMDALKDDPEKLFDFDPDA